MTRIVVAAGINNELWPKDVSAIQRLKQGGYEVLFYYYLPKIPAQFSMIPSFNEELKGWRQHANQILDTLGNKLNIPKEDRHFVDEVLGPERVIDEARAMQAAAILTNNKEKLKQSPLSKFYDWLLAIFERKRATTLPIENVSQYVNARLGELKPSKIATAHRAIVTERGDQAKKSKAA
jgi:hypothetical protein